MANPFEDWGKTLPSGETGVVVYQPKPPKKSRRKRATKERITKIWIENPPASSKSEKVQGTVVNEKPKVVIDKDEEKRQRDIESAISTQRIKQMQKDFDEKEKQKKKEEKEAKRVAKEIEKKRKAKLRAMEKERAKMKQALKFKRQTPLAKAIRKRIKIF
jgi:hypothetical protein